MSIEKLKQAYKEGKSVSLYYNNNYIGMIDFSNNRYCYIDNYYSIYVYARKSKQFGFIGLRFVINYDTFIINN